LDGMLPPDSRDLVERLYQELRQAHGALMSLEHPRPAQT
jgi:hypothetical protein